MSINMYKVLLIYCELNFTKVYYQDENNGTCDLVFKCQQIIQIMKCTDLQYNKIKAWNFQTDVQSVNKCQYQVPSLKALLLNETGYNGSYDPPLSGKQFGD